jgi:pectinesterase
MTRARFREFNSSKLGIVISAEASMRDAGKSVRAEFSIGLSAFAVMAACWCGSARGADYLVDPNYGGVNGAPFGAYAGAYNSVVAALGTGGVASGASATNQNKIYFAPGTYNTAATTGVTLSNSKNNIALLGLTGNPNDVVITSTLDGALAGTTGSSTLQLKGNNVSAVGITFGNSTNTPYIVNVSHLAVNPDGTNSATAQTSNSPAVALLLQGDQQAFQNCKFLGYQDTLYTKGGRSYFKDCYVSGDIDFIFANGTTVFRSSTINLDGDHVGGTITAASTDKRTSNGLVFLGCTITGDPVKGNPVIDPQNAASAVGPPANNMNLGRPWGWQQVGGDASTVFINTKMAPTVKNTGWLTWNANETNVANGKQDGNPAKDSRYAEYNSMDLVGNPLDVSGRVAWSKQMAASIAAAYQESNLFAFESGYAWYGLGYAGSADPNSPNFSWPAFWGDRNSNNDTANATVSAVYPAPGNPSAYTNPSWTLTSNWDPSAQLALVPEPGSLSLVVGAAMLVGSRSRKRK